MNGDDLISIIAVTSANYKDVFNFWQDSLDRLEYPCYRRHVRDLGLLPPPHGYCTDSWRYAIDEQLREVVRWLRTHQGEFFIHTDTDIQFFPRFLVVQGEWLEWMEALNLDMLFMRERTQVMPELRRGEVNAGFYMVRCNERTLSFWEQVLADELADPKMSGYPPYTDQYHLNRRLEYRPGAYPQEGHCGVRWAVIPDLHCVWSEPESEHEMRLAAFHHAVNTRDKPALLKRVRDAVAKEQQHDAAKAAVARRVAKARWLAKRLAQRFVGSGPEATVPRQLLPAVRLSVRWAEQHAWAFTALPPLSMPSRLLPPGRGKTGSVALPIDEGIPADDGVVLLASCAECGVHSGCWQALFWCAEDGDGYCSNCWKRWWKAGLPLTKGIAWECVG